MVKPEKFGHLHLVTVPLIREPSFNSNIFCSFTLNIDENMFCILANSVSEAAIQSCS